MWSTTPSVLSSRLTPGLVERMSALSAALMVCACAAAALSASARTEAEMRITLVPLLFQPFGAPGRARRDLLGGLEDEARGRYSPMLTCQARGSELSVET